VTSLLDPIRKLHTKQLLIFDFDGTVADSSPLHARAFHKVLRPYGVTVNYPSIAGLRTLDALRCLLGEVALNLSAAELNLLVTSKQQTVRAMIASELVPLAGVDVFLRWARSRFMLAMASSGSRETVELGLERLGYGGWFTPLLCSEDVRLPKPNPEIFLCVLEHAKVPAADAIIFEDSEAGLAAAQSAGIDSYDIRIGGWAPWASVTGLDL